ncbi:MAG: GtrA family protein [Lachnospiraceae bacterium]|nr:GtrA family protein [Lachnospiraceae bacterium]
MNKHLRNAKIFSKFHGRGRNLCIREIISYILTGGATTFVNYAVYLTLLHFQVNYLWSNTIAWIFAVTFAYISNRVFVFRSENQVAKEMISFLSLRFLTLLLENLLLTLFIQWMELPPLLSKIGVSFITVAANYIICKCQIFQKPVKYTGTSANKQKGELIHE